ncbi:MAG: DUF1365 domain-containing protein [Mycobacteriaceae bacterium]
MMTPAIYRTTIHHVRNKPIHNSFTYHSYTWFVDLNELPQLPRWIAPLARFYAKDHFGDPQKSIRDNVDTFLAARGIDLGGGQVTMLANARVCGQVFNPLSVYWCRDNSGTIVAIIAEVHNTYGERHCYLVFPDDNGVAQVDKEFYVSPFNDMSGSYTMRLPEPDDTLRLSIALHRELAPPFTASVHGVRSPATTKAILQAFISLPLAPLRVVIQIRWQGIKLWSKKMKIYKRPIHVQQEVIR